MGASKPIYLQVQAMRDMWREIWWQMADGKKTEYDKIKGTDVFEFWKLFDLWNAAITREREYYKQKNHSNGKQQ